MAERYKTVSHYNSSIDKATENYVRGKINIAICCRKIKKYLDGGQRRLEKICSIEKILHNTQNRRAQ